VALLPDGRVVHELLTTIYLRRVVFTPDGAIRQTVTLPTRDFVSSIIGYYDDTSKQIEIWTMESPTLLKRVALGCNYDYQPDAVAFSADGRSGWLSGTIQASPVLAAPLKAC